jgi:hypothetical protein
MRGTEDDSAHSSSSASSDRPPLLLHSRKEPASQLLGALGPGRAGFVSELPTNIASFTAHFNWMV